MSTEIEHLTALAAELRDALQRYSPDDPRVELPLAHLHLALRDAGAVLMSASDFSLACCVLNEEISGLRDAIEACTAMLRQFADEATGGFRTRTNVKWLQNAFVRVADELRALKERIGPTPCPNGEAALKDWAEGILAQLSEYTEAQ